MANLAIFESAAYLTPGVAATAADVEVRLVSSGAIAAIWSNEAGTTPITNPAIAFTDAVDGSFKFYAAGADRGYTVKVTKGAATKTITAAIGTAAQLDQSQILLQSTFTAKGGRIIATGAGASAQKAAPANGYVSVANSAASDGWTDVPFMPKNPLINGCFRINQRAPATNADDTYAHDRWYTLNQTNPIAVSTLTDVENGLPFMARLTQSNAVAQRMGYAQIIEGKDCKHMRGKQVTFRFGRTRLSTSANVRVAVLEWTGTEDAVTSDVVNDWTSAVYTAANFFLAASLTVSGVVQQALTAATLADGSPVTVTLGSAFTNLIVFTWTEATVAQNVTLDVGRPQIELGGVATEFERRPIQQEIALCQRYLPAYNAGSTTDQISFGLAVNGTTVLTQIPFQVEPRIAPTGVTVSNSTHFSTTDGTGTPIACTTITFSGTASKRCARLSTVVAAGLTAGQGSLLSSNNASAQLLFTGSEL